MLGAGLGAAAQCGELVLCQHVTCRRRTLETFDGARTVTLGALAAKQHDAHIVESVAAAAPLSSQRKKFKRFFVIARDARWLALVVRKPELQAALAAAAPAPKCHNASQWRGPWQYRAAAS